MRYMAMDAQTKADLIDGYFKLRDQSEGLRDNGAHFEGLHWFEDGDQMMRASKGWVLSVYRCEGGIEASVRRPDGTFSTYS